MVQIHNLEYSFLFAGQYSGAFLHRLSQRSSFHLSGVTRVAGSLLDLVPKDRDQRSLYKHINHTSDKQAFSPTRTLRQERPIEAATLVFGCGGMVRNLQRSHAGRRAENMQTSHTSHLPCKLRLLSLCLFCLDTVPIEISVV